MAFRCGIDIVEIDRIKESFESLGQAFRDRIFTEGEITYCEGRRAARFESYAARFAAKEAVAKALGTGIGSRFGWKDIEVLNDGAGSPYVVLSHNAGEFAAASGFREISVSLSHCRQYAVANVVVEKVESLGGGLTDKG
ncbi:MAG: holo-ACP synthase [Clostridiales bacterium]|nr:holo-ACP synthase [Clostridiales bacterium]